MKVGVKQGALAGRKQRRLFGVIETMITITKQAEQFLEALAQALEIPPSRYEQAETSYRSLGEWLHRPESAIGNYAPDVFVQGSFRLGTVTKPQSNEEEYDVDCACSLTALDKTDISQAALKELVGDEIKLYRKSKGITKPVHEGRRCWRLEYADGAQFHMDIVPCLPNGSYQRTLLESRNLDASYADTAIAITDNEVADFHLITDDWPRSNPRSYANWFESRMGEVFIRRRDEILREMRTKVPSASIEDIPTYRVRTPLQSSIMILKRHRDLMFADDPTVKPISIIISTLAAHAYNNEASIGYALLSILSRMGNAIEHDGEKYIIRNPTDGLENFADKWRKHPERAHAFFRWLEQARTDFMSASQLAEHRRMSTLLEDRLGRDLVGRVTEDVLQPARPGGASLLQGATAASAAAPTGVSFADKPRVPKKPDGFA